MYDDDRVLLVRRSHVGIASNHTSLALTVHGPSGFLSRFDYIRDVEVVLNILVFFDETSPTSGLVFIFW